MTPHRPTQKDVAKRAGVSQAMVSMIVNGVGDQSIPPETVERIRAAARDLGYRPNRFAQALKTRRTMTIACIVPDITNPFYPGLIRGVQGAAAKRGYDVITVNTDGAPESERHFLDWARQGRVDGVVGVFFSLRAGDFSELLAAGVGVVRIESARKRGGPLAVDDIFVDSRQASEHVTRYLLAKGHRRIAMVAGTGGPQPVRVEGYAATMAAAGLKPSVLVEGAFNEEGGLRAAERLLAGRRRPTAVFAANDLMAIGVMLALRERSVAVPGDMAVVGFDDILAARLVTPALTTVAQYQDGMGGKAVEILLERLNGMRTGPGTTHEMPYRFIERGSS